MHACMYVCMYVPGLRGQGACVSLASECGRTVCSRGQSSLPTTHLSLCVGPEREGGEEGGRERAKDYIYKKKYKD